MGAICSNMNADEQTKINFEINKQIKKDEDDDLGNQKLLLLGTGECGKSTILKQINILHNRGYSQSDLQSMSGAVYSNILSGMAQLLRAREKFMFSLSKPGIETDVNYILSLADSGKDSLPFVQQTTDSLKKLWNEPCIKKTYERRSEFQLGDSFIYFIEQLDRISSSSFIPNVDDLLRIRVPTTGVVQSTINIKGTLFRIYDVGGQRSERRKWIHLFDDVHAIIFISAINEYDLKLNEDSKTNRMRESLDLFEQICNSRWFVTASMILFLNKRDLFEEKLKTVNINVLFNNYRGSNDFHQSLMYIRELFEGMNRHCESKRIYCHVTCATDTDQVQKVIDSVVDMVIGSNNNFYLVFQDVKLVGLGFGNRRSFDNSKNIEKKGKNHEEEITVVPAKKGGRPSKIKNGSDYTEYKPYEVAKFLELVESEKLVWDSSDNNYHRKEKRNEAFNEIELICGKFMPRGRIHGDNARKLWDQMAAVYKLERKKSEGLPSGSGTYKPKFPYMGNMSFLDFDRSNREVTNTHVIGPSEGCKPKGIERKHQGTPKRKAHSDDMESLLEVMKEGNRVLERACGSWKVDEKVQKQDEDLHQLLDIVISEKYGIEKLQVKSEIAKFLFEKRRHSDLGSSDFSLNLFNQ